MTVAPRQTAVTWDTWRGWHSNDTLAIMGRFARAHLTAECIGNGEEPSREDFLEAYRSAEDVPALIARLRRYEPLA